MTELAPTVHEPFLGGVRTERVLRHATPVMMLALASAKRAAKRRGHAAVHPAHLLAATVRDWKSDAPALLDAIGVSRTSALDAIEEALRDVPTGPWTDGLAQRTERLVRHSWLHGALHRNASVLRTGEMLAAVLRTPGEYGLAALGLGDRDIPAALLTRCLMQSDEREEVEHLPFGRRRWYVRWKHAMIVAALEGRGTVLSENELNDLADLAQGFHARAGFEAWVAALGRALASGASTVGAVANASGLAPTLPEAEPRPIAPPLRKLDRDAWAAVTVAERAAEERGKNVTIANVLFAALSVEGGDLSGLLEVLHADQDVLRAELFAQRGREAANDDVPEWIADAWAGTFLARGRPEAGPRDLFLGAVRRPSWVRHIPTLIDVPVAHVEAAVRRCDSAARAAACRRLDEVLEAAARDLPQPPSPRGRATISGIFQVRYANLMRAALVNEWIDYARAAVRGRVEAGTVAPLADEAVSRLDVSALQPARYPTAPQRTARQRTAQKRTAQKRTAQKRTARQRTARKRTAQKRTARQRTARKRTMQSASALPGVAPQKEEPPRYVCGDVMCKAEVELGALSSIRWPIFCRDCGSPLLPLDELGAPAVDPGPGIEPRALMRRTSDGLEPVILRIAPSQEPSGRARFVCGMAMCKADIPLADPTSVSWPITCSQCQARLAPLEHLQTTRHDAPDRPRQLLERTAQGLRPFSLTLGSDNTED